MPGEFNPANSQMRVGHERLQGVFPEVTYDHKFVSESLANEQSFIELDSIIANAQASEPLPSKIATNGDIEVELDPESYLPYLVNIQRNNSSTEPATDAFLHKLAPSETASAAPTTLGVEVWRDDDLGQYFRAGRVQELTINVENSNVAKATFGMLFARSDYMGPGVEVEDGATPNSSIPHARGIPDHANWTGGVASAAAHRLWVKLTSVAGLPGTVVARAKVGAGAYGSSGTFDITIGVDADGKPVWNRILDDNGLDISTRANPQEIFIELPTGLEVDDEWSFDGERGVWTPSYPDVPNFNEIFTYILIDDAAVCIQGITMQLVRPLQPQDCIGAAFADQILSRGQRVVTWSINREYVDTSLRKKLETGTPFGIRVEMYSGVEFETGHEHELTLVSSRVKAQGRTTSVGSKDAFPETIDAQAFPNPTDGNGNVDDLTIYVKNSIEDPNVVAP